MPSAWMISSNGTEATIKFFLRTIRTENPSIHPKNFMSDKDQGQLNAIKGVYPESRVFLCWWHVLHAWQQHFATTSFPELWELMKRWIRITDKISFDACWHEIQSIAPASVIEYLKINWLNETELWSAVFRQDRSIFQICDTNMLVEACVYFLHPKI